MDDLDRLHDLLLRRVKETRPELLTRPFEIAELYQTLVPYRLYRRELAIDTNEDYEIAMMRLLAGERDYIVGDQGMQEFLQSELASPNPDTGVFREFGSNHVAFPRDVAISAADEVPSEAPPAIAVPASTAAPVIPVVPVAPESADAAAEHHEHVGKAIEALESVPLSAPPAPPPAQPTPAAPTRIDPMTITKFVSSSDLGGRCRYCSGSLPEGRKLVFCPHCGQNLTVLQCPACSTELEMGWRFCVTCGRGVNQAAT